MTKISQYTPITSLVNGDLIDTSQDSGGGIYATKSIDFQDLQSSIFYNRTENGATIQEVRTATDLPSVLIANTTYVIIGEVTISTSINVTNDGCAIVGLDRNKDILNYSGTGTFLTITDVNFTLRNLQIKGTGVGSTILSATNFTIGVSANNYGRTKVLTLFSCEFRNCVNFGTILGFELVDINNSLFWYITGTTGIQFQDVRHLEISSCEVFNWFDESTGLIYSTAKMIELLANGVDNVGFAVVNINGCIVHPEQTQDGLTMNALSTTIFGTISANTFINVGLTTGILFDVDYDIQNSTIIQANQGIQNGNAKISMQLSDNANRLQTITGDPSQSNPIIFKGTNMVTGAFTNAITFPISQRMIGTISDCSFTYDTKIEGNFLINVNMVLLHTNGADTLATVQLRRNGVDMVDGYYQAQLKDDAEFPLAFSVLTTASISTPDVFDFEMSVRGKAPPYALDNIKDVTVVSLVVNAYQF